MSKPTHQDVAAFIDAQADANELAKLRKALADHLARNSPPPPKPPPVWVKTADVVAFIQAQENDAVAERMLQQVEARMRALGS